MSDLPYTWTRDHLNKIITSGNTSILSKDIYKEAFMQIDRGHFVPEEFQDIAYMDKEIELESGQKIDKPTLLAKQIEALQPRKGGRYLEIGAGSGYAAAVIGEIIKPSGPVQDKSPSGKLFALERILFLVEEMRDNFRKYPELESIVEPVFLDGTLGYKSEAPYDGILFSVACDEVDEELKHQLKIGGKIVYAKTDFEIRVIERPELDRFDERVYPGFMILDKIQEGVE